MPNYIRLFEIHKTKIEPTYMLLRVRVLAVRHLRTILAKSILKVHVKTIIVNKQRPTENPTCLSKKRLIFFLNLIFHFQIAIINGPCGIWDSKQSIRHQDLFHGNNLFQSDNSDVDVIYFDVSTDNQEFCGQSAIPLSSLRKGFFFFLEKKNKL